MVTVRLSRFDPWAIAQSGQCFRMSGDDKGVTARAGGRCVRVERSGAGRFTFSCDQDEYARVWRPYFDLDTDYAAMQNAAPPNDAFLRRAMRAGRGLRILRQEPWETLICFILSQRKSIPAIRGCTEQLCARFGEPCGDGWAFPTAERLAEAADAELRACGLGYRAPYVLATARRVAQGALDNLSTLADDALLERLMAMEGVGVKVANCVALFGYHRLACAPVDVWIARVIEEEYAGQSPFEGYGAYAGLYQQYLFCGRRAAESR